MFACALLTGKKFYTTTYGHVIVAFDPKQVLPCWVITFKSKHKPSLYYTPAVAISHARVKDIAQAQKDLVEREKEFLFKLDEIRGMYVDFYRLEQLVNSQLASLVTFKLNHAQHQQPVFGECMTWKDAASTSNYILVPCIFKWEKKYADEMLTFDVFRHIIGCHKALCTNGSVRWKRVVYNISEVAPDTVFIHQLLPVQTVHKQYLQTLSNVHFCQIGM